MAESTNLEELQKLSEKISGNASAAENIAEAIEEITKYYSNGGGGGVAILSAYLYPDSDDVIQKGAVNLSNGTTIDITLKYIPEFNLDSSEGSIVGTTKLTPDNTLEKGHSYRYAFDVSPSKPAIGQNLSDYAEWDGVSDIEAGDSAMITLVEVDEQNNALKVGLVSAVIKY